MRIARIAVVGSRDYQNLDAVRQFIREQDRTTVIISGGARGVDAVAVEEARRLRMPYEIYPAEWHRYGRRAGAMRNHTIVEKADEVVAFWDGKSAGTKITIDLARASKKPVRIVDDRDGLWTSWTCR